MGSHTALLKASLPPGSYDPNGSNLGAELTAEGNALDLAQWYADQILIEADPRTASLMLADWERVYGLPDGCVVAAAIVQSTGERRAALVAREAMQGGQSRAYFIALAASIGYAITITEGHPHTTQDDTQDPVNNNLQRFVWYVNAPLNTVINKTTQDDTQMATAVWNNTMLECVINRFKPGEMLVLFLYS